jgi:hypothetical protein
MSRAYRIDPGIPAEAIIERLSAKYPEWKFSKSSIGSHFLIRMTKGMLTISISRMALTNKLRVYVSFPFLLKLMTLNICSLIVPIVAGSQRAAVYDEVGQHFGT